MAVHRLARTGFQASSDAYERGRPSYPPDAVAWLVEALRIGPGSAVVDLAAGTGKLTRLLVPTGARLVAVEPVEAMRAKLAEMVPGMRVLDGTAEAMPLPDGSADAVTVGQAFHWFDGPRALAEIARVLRPGGRLGLAWNTRDQSVGWVARLTELMDRHADDAPRHRGGRWRDAFEETEAFTPLVERHFVFAQPLDRAGVLDRVVSTSFIGALPDAERAALLAEVSDLLATDPATRGAQTVRFPYRSEVFWTERRFA